MCLTLSFIIIYIFTIPGADCVIGQDNIPTVQTDEFAADVAAAAFADSAFHPHFQGGNDLIVLIAHFFQRLQDKLDHDGGPQTTATAPAGLG